MEMTGRMREMEEEGDLDIDQTQGPEDQDEGRDRDPDQEPPAIDPAIDPVIPEIYPDHQLSQDSHPDQDYRQDQKLTSRMRTCLTQISRTGLPRKPPRSWRRTGRR